MSVVEFPQPQPDEYTSMMTLLECVPCHKSWVGLYEVGVRLSDLHCPYCGSHDIWSRQGAREVFFYDYREGDGG